MASPQKENGFTPVANELLEAMTRDVALGRKARALLWVMRQTYGWKKKECELSAYQMANDTGMDYRDAKRTLNVLRHAGRITAGGVQKDYDLWGVKMPRGQVTPPLGGHATPYPPYSKEKKEKSILIQDQKRLVGEWFERRWKGYPKKVGREPALKAVLRINPPAPLLAKIEAALDRYVASCAGKEKQYILHLATWFNQKRWEDENDESISKAKPAGGFLL